MTAGLHDPRLETIRALALATDASMDANAGQGGDGSGSGSGEQGGTGGTGGAQQGQNGAQNGQGGSGSGSEGGGTGGTGSGTQGQQGGSGQQGGDQGGQGGDTRSLDHLSPSDRAYVEQLRREAGDRRQGQRSAEGQRDEASTERDQLRGVLDQLRGVLDPQGQTQDPAQLAEQYQRERDQAQQTAREQAVNLAVFQRAGEAGVDPVAVTDSSAAQRVLYALDPTAQDFGTRLDAALRDLAASNSRLAVQRQAARSGSEFTGSGAPPSGERPKSLRDAFGRRGTN